MPTYIGYDSYCSLLITFSVIIILSIIDIQNHGRMRISSFISVLFPLQECMPVYPISYSLALSLALSRSLLPSLPISPSIFNAPQVPRGVGSWDCKLPDLMSCSHPSLQNLIKY